MKFRTEIEIAPLGTKIGYENRILALGSCFAEHIAGRLAQAKFRVTANPSGILFNPLSIAAALRSYADEARWSPTATAGPPRSSRGAGWAWTRSSPLSQTSWQVRSAAGR